MLFRPAGARRPLGNFLKWDFWRGIYLEPLDGRTLAVYYILNKNFKIFNTYWTPGPNIGRKNILDLGPYT